MLPTTVDIFTDFGPSAFLRRLRASTLPIGRDRAKLRRELRAACPAEAGVYGMVDRSGRLIYVGTSIRIRDRLLDYFHGARESHPLPRSRNLRKELRIAGRSKQLVWEVVGHELLALLRELELIRRFQPDLNVRGRNKRRLTYLYLTPDEAPRFKVGPRLPRSCRHHWGPLSGLGHLSRVAEWLNRHYKLAECPERVAIRFADQREFFSRDERPGCLRGEVNACLGPCAGLCSRREYMCQVHRARDVLDGRSDVPLRFLREAIRVAVAQQRFERAAQLRDALADLELLCDRLIMQRRPQRHDFVYPAQIGRRNVWMLIHAGQVLAARPEPRTAISAVRWLSRLQPLVEREPTAVDDRDATDARIVASWFRGNPSELLRAIPFADAVLHCRRLADATHHRIATK